MPDLLTILVIGLFIWIALSVDDSGEETALEPDPYRDGLEAASRISAMGWEAEALMHREALRALDEKEEAR